MVQHTQYIRTELVGENNARDNDRRRLTFNADQTRCARVHAFLYGLSLTKNGARIWVSSSRVKKNHIVYATDSFDSSDVCMTLRRGLAQSPYPRRAAKPTCEAHVRSKLGYLLTSPIDERLRRGWEPDVVFADIFTHIALSCSEASPNQFLARHATCHALNLEILIA